MKNEVEKRHDISDKAWKKIEPYLPGQRGQWGGIAENNRRFINAVFWIFRTGAPWRDLPKRYGCWSNTHRRFIRWRAKGVWERVLEQVANQPDYQWLMIDASHIKVQFQFFMDAIVHNVKRLVTINAPPLFVGA